MTASEANGSGGIPATVRHQERNPPGSDGEHALQQRLGSQNRAARFYDDQVLDHLNARMRDFTRQQEMFFLATSDRNGECDSTFRAGPAGFLRVLDERTLVFPEYRGNGVHASLGNIQENPHLGILMIDFVRARIGLHINGSAEVLEDADLRATVPDLPEDPVPGRRALLWVRVTVEEAYIHCAKHIPHLQKAPRRAARDWGTDDYKRKGGDFFGAARDAREARATQEAEPASVAEPAPVAEPATVPAPAAVSAPGSASAAGPAPAPDSASTPGSVSAPAPASGPAPTTSAPTPAAAVPAPRPPVVPARPASAAAPAPLPEEAAAPSAPLAPATPATSSVPAAPATPSTPSAPSAVSAAMSARAGLGADEHGRAADGSAWRQRAEQALQEAQRRGAEREPAPFQGWFG